ncbi:PP2C family protein-serine/threonine phosphatase [Streptomyces sirii]|uniref:PP2C family protein-serine/threonine phosphatase n=1 Tax=Streptomyces sirii TaxID=3127701 RepID=UPI003D35CE27
MLVHPDPGRGRRAAGHLRDVPPHPQGPRGPGRGAQRRVRPDHRAGHPTTPRHGGRPRRPGTGEGRPRGPGLRARCQHRDHARAALLRLPAVHGPADRARAGAAVHRPCRRGRPDPADRGGLRVPGRGGVPRLPGHRRRDRPRGRPGPRLGHHGDRPPPGRRSPTEPDQAGAPAQDLDAPGAPTPDLDDLGAPASNPDRPDPPDQDLDVTRYVCVPLTTRGRTFGVLTLVATPDRPLDCHVIALAEELARRAASSADNAHQFTDRVRLARDLQAGLLPPALPRIPGADLAASYHPAGEGLDVGGDFYDVFPLPDDRWAFMIGDVCGRGAAAATTTGMVRHTARAAARLLTDSAAVVAAINDALAQSTTEDNFVSLVYGELRCSASGLTLDLIRAGHVPPLIRRADGTVEVIAEPGLLLGIAPDFDGTSCRVDLRPGDSLVLVTDGITEARASDGEFFDEHRLADALAAVRSRTALRGRTSPTASTLIEAVTAAVTAFAGDSTPDDQAALVLTAT